MAEWSKLDGDLLLEIARRIGAEEDFVNFIRVCFSWRAAVFEKNFGYASTKIPWLMLPRKTSHLRSFLRVSTGETRKVFLPEVNGKRYFSSKGWLITNAAQDLNMTLLHPFSSIQIKLPHLKTFENFEDLQTRNNMVSLVSFIHRCALSACPISESNYILMVIHGQNRNLGYYKRGSKSWTTIMERQCAYKDVAYYDGQFYAIDYDNRIVACYFRGRDTATVTVVARMPEHVPNSCPFYLVESAGSLLVVARLIEREWSQSRSKRAGQTLGFKVFRVELDTKTCSEVKDLGNRAIFLGYNSSSSFRVEDSLIESNSIYFTEDSWRNPRDGTKNMGIYNIKDKTINLQFWCNLCHPLNPVMWV